MSTVKCAFGALAVVMVLACSAQANARITCATVWHWFDVFGGVAGAKAYAAANGITLTSEQIRQIRTCLRQGR